MGGAEVALLNRLAAMNNDRYHHKVVCFYDGPIVQQIRALGIDVMVNKGFVKGYDPIGLWQLYKVMRNFNPDIIHTSLWAANMVGRLFGFIVNIPVINELHGNVEHEGRVRNGLERLSVRGAKRIVAVSASVRRVYEQCIMSGLSIPSKSLITQRLVTIANGIDRKSLINKMERTLLSRSDFGFSAQDFIIGAIGRFEKIKSYDVLIRSVAHLCQLLDEKERNKIKLCLTGEGSQRHYLQVLVQQLKLEKQVVFTGYRLDAFRFYSLFDCFALSSQSEGLSIALLEALAVGLPIITTHLEKDHDAVIQNVNGLLIPVNDVEAYAQGLLQLYHRRIKKSDDYSPLCVYPFSIDNVVASYEAMYRDIMIQEE